MSTFTPLHYREGEDGPSYTVELAEGRSLPLQGKCGQLAMFFAHSDHRSDHQILAALIKQNFHNYFYHPTDHRVYSDLIMLLDKLHSRRTPGWARNRLMSLQYRYDKRVCLRNAYPFYNLYCLCKSSPICMTFVIILIGTTPWIH